MKISLVCPTNYYGESATRGIYYPMGVLSVGSLIKDSFPSYDVSVIDGELYSKEELIDKIKDADVLGLSANTNNYPLCLELAETAKEQGSKVVIGGPHATALPTQILRNRDYVDAVIVNDGEESFLEYLIGGDLSRIPNLVWRDNGEIKHNLVNPPTKPVRLVDMDFSLIPLESYWEEHKKEFPDMDERYVEGFTHVGCNWREKSGGCKFCDIPYPFNNYQAPGRFWRDLQELRRERGVTSFKDYGDCLTGNPERVRALLEARSSSLDDVDFSCYGRSIEITEEMADLLRDLNVRYVYIGFDSGSTKMLKLMRQGYAVKHNHAAAERLERRGINITGSLILGAEEENEETIEETERFAREIIQHPNVTQLHCAVLNVFPGSFYGHQMAEEFPQLKEDDVWDVMETQRLWADRYCNVSQDVLQERANVINNLNPSSRKRFFGLRKPLNNS